MKKILTIVSFLFSLAASAQNTHQVSNANTNEQFQGTVEAKVGFINAHFTDTTAANLSWVSHKPFSQITTGQGNFWLRDATATKWIGTGTASINISPDSSSLIICNGIGACDTIPVAVAPINNFTVINDTTIVVCGVSSCDTVYTVPINYNQNVVNSVSVVNGTTVDSVFYFINGVKYLAGTVSLAGASSISLSSDSTYLLICNNSGCDTFYFNSIAPVTNFTVLNDTTIVVCGTSCDTLHTVPTNYNSNYVNSVGVNNDKYVDTVTYTINGTKHIAGYIDKRDTLLTQLPLYVDTTSVTGERILKIMQADGIIGTCPVIWDSLLVFSTPPCNAIIGGNLYSSPANTMTLTPADTTYPTQYLFVFDSTGITTFIRGIPSASPTVPQYDPLSQLPLTSGIVIAANATTPPSNISNNRIVYDEGLGTAGSEWNTSSTGTISYDTLDTNNPYHLTHDISVHTYTNGSGLNFAAGSNQIFTAGDILTLYIYTNGAFPKKNKISIGFYNGSTLVTNFLQLTAYGFNTNNGNIYQIVSIPLSAFNWTNGGTYNKFRLTFQGNDVSGTGGLFLDYFTIQNNNVNVTPPTDYSNKVDSSTITKVNDSTYVLNDWIKGVKYPRLDTIHVHAGGGGGGTVTQFNFTNSTGITGTVTNATTTPTLSLVIDSSAIGSFYVKVRSLFNATSPIVYSNGNISLDTTVVHTSNYNNATYQGKLTLTTLGTNGASTLTGNTLNIPQYSGNDTAYVAMQPAPDSSYILFKHSNRSIAPDTLSVLGGSVNSVIGNPTTLVDNTDPKNPIVQQDATKLNKSDSSLYSTITRLKDTAASIRSIIPSSLVDTIPLFVYVAGAGITGDTSLFSVTAIYGSFYMSGSDTFHITKMIIGLQGTSPNVTVRIYWNDSLNVTAGATTLTASGTVATNTTTGTSVTSFSNSIIPPGNFVWCVTSGVTTKPTFMTVTLEGYKTHR